MNGLNDLVANRKLAQAIIVHFVEAVGPAICIAIQEEVDAGYSNDEIAHVLESLWGEQLIVNAGQGYAQLYRLGMLSVEIDSAEEKDNTGDGHGD